MTVSLPKLPDPVLRRILEFLLIAEHCKITRKSKQTKLCRAYLFQLNILRTCKRLYDEGTAVFKLNNFILASTTGAEHTFITEAQDHAIVVWNKGLNAFKNYNARLHLLSWKLKGHPVHFFMLCSADLEDFVCILRFLTFTDLNPHFDIHLKLGAPGSDSLALRDQEAILLPWEKLVGVQQRCKVTGVVDRALAKRVETNAAPTVFWSRAQCRDFLDILEHEMRMADDAASKKHFHVSHHIYHKLNDIMETPGRIGKVMHQFTVSGDNVLALHFADTVSRNQHGVMLANMWKAFDTPTHYLARPYFDEMIVAGSYAYGSAAASWHKTAHWEQIQAMTHVGQGEYKLAQKRFANAMRLNSSEKTYLAGYKKCTEMLRSPRTSRTFAVFKDLMQLMPLAQPKSEYDFYVSFLAGADEERHHLRAHGYSGPLYMDTIKQKVGVSLNRKFEEVHKSFNTATFDKRLGASVLTCMHSIQKGIRAPDIHIGPGAAGSSHAEMMEAFRKLQLNRCPHPRTNGDRSPELAYMLHMTDMLNTYGVGQSEVQAGGGFLSGLMS